jgi:hypothetical protein
MNDKQLPRMVCISGSARFADQKAEAARAEVEAGRVVITTPDMQAELDAMSPARREAALSDLALVHRLLIEQADEELIVNPGGYIGAHTAAEIEHSRAHGKPVRFTEPQANREAGA